MSYVQVGTCPHCGAPIYSPMTWNAITPPPVIYSCNCVPHTNGNTSTGTSSWSE